jgi:hypothetical protein
MFAPKPATISTVAALSEDNMLPPINHCENFADVVTYLSESDEDDMDDEDCSDVTGENHDHPVLTM